MNTIILITNERKREIKLNNYLIKNGNLDLNELINE